jgi:hypothetical protein
MLFVDNTRNLDWKFREKLDQGFERYDPREKSQPATSQRETRSQTARRAAEVDEARVQRAMGKLRSGHLSRAMSTILKDELVWFSDGGL